MALFAEYGTILVLLACVFGFFMAWGIGANDVANAMGTSVGAKALTIGQAIFVAMIFEFAGAYLAGGEVSSTIRKGVIASDVMEGQPELLVFGMMASLLAAGTWLLIASMRGWPVSTTHSIVGAIVGFAAVGISVDAVNWGKVGQIAASWVVSPLLAGTIACILFLSAERLILNAKDPIRNAIRYIPGYMFLVGFMIAMVTILKGLKHVLKDDGISFTFAESAMMAAVVGIIVAIIGSVLIRRVDVSQGEHNANIERIFAILMVFTACTMAFAHGSNDVANAVGPIAAIINTVESGSVAAKGVMPSWVLLLGGVGIVLGLATYGFKVMATIGKKITELTPSRGFAAELAAASTVVLASATGLPISTTHTLVGAVLGVGLARGLSTLDLKVIGSIVGSWLVTLPAGACLSIIFFYILRASFT